MELPVPVQRYQTPGAEMATELHVANALSGVAPHVVPESALPTESSRAPSMVSLLGTWVAHEHAVHDVLSPRYVPLWAVQFACVRT
jgi:hypothetical protein